MNARRNRPQTPVRIAVFGHQRSGNHYLAALVNENFFHLPCYKPLLIDHPVLRNVPPRRKHLFIHRNFDDVAKSMFEMRARWALKVDSLEEFLSRRYCDMYDANVESKMIVDFNDGQDGRVIHGTSGYFEKKAQTPKQWHDW